MMNDIAALGALQAMLGGANIQSGTDIVSPEGEDVFGQVLAQAAAAGEATDEVQDISTEEVETADVTAGKAEPRTEKELSELITDEGRNAFLQTLMQYLVSNTETGLNGTMSMKSLLSSDVWDGVTLEEKSAYTGLTMLLSGNDMTDTDSLIADMQSMWGNFLYDGRDDSEEWTLKDVFDSLIKLPVIDRKLFTKDTDENTAADMAAMMMGMLGQNVLNVTEVTGSTAAATNGIAAAEAVSGIRAELVQIPENVPEEVLVRFCEEFAQAAGEMEGEDAFLPENALVTDEASAEESAQTAAVTEQTVQAAPQDSIAFVSRFAADMRTAQNADIRETEISVSAALAAAGNAVQTEHGEDVPETEALMLAEDIDEQIMAELDVSQIHLDSENGVKELSMKLRPEELGSLEIRIVKSDKGVSVTFTAESSEAAKLINEKASVLADALAARGIEVAGLTVESVKNDRSDDMSYGGDQGRNAQYEASDGDSSKGGRQSYDGQNADNGETSAEADNLIVKEARLWTTA